MSQSPRGLAPPRRQARYPAVQPPPATVPPRRPTLPILPRPASMPAPQRPFSTCPPSPLGISVPENEECTDCESDYSDDDCSTRPIRSSFLGVGTSINRASVRNSFLGVRTSITRPPRDIEEAAAAESCNSSASTLAGTPRIGCSEDIREKVELELDPFEAHGLSSAPLPPKKGTRLYRFLRWNFGSVYRRIFCLVFVANMAAMAFLIARHASSAAPFTYQQASTAVTANILAAILVRNEHVVNAMFWVFGTWTKNLPLRMRILAAKVYSYGGIHSGGAVAATFWYLAFVVLLTAEFQSADSLSVVRSYVYFASYFILFLLVSMVISAHPHLRRIMHNWFEGIHRFMGWLAVLLFWAQTMLLAADATQGSDVPLGRAILVSPNFWMLIAITLLVIYPWTRLRLRDVEAEVLSKHCVKLNFKHRNVHYGQAIRLTDAALKETHAFGVIPFPAAPLLTAATTTHCPGCTCPHNQPSPLSTASNDDDNEKKQPTTLASIKHLATTTPTPLNPLTHTNERGFSVIVSAAGDWTRKIIASPPRQLYTRGTPQFGVLRVAGLFTPCVVVATGSGIAPCLSLFVQRPDHPVRIIWSTKQPVATYGAAVVELVYRTDPDAVVIDTSAGGPGNKRPDLVKLAYRVMEEGREVVRGRGRERGQAVVVISNQKVTRKVVYGLESRGVPAYGAIFDS